ncbi:Tetratricopeptide-like helical domain containing protein [Parasponia andersonii]|uniref:Tetratricopeptide-like helical domain containing protein n=1 Tax=Parasponia andersonii TaxID=3476 RepID=A0A2P5E4V4_PARAD|nr:Tetratricopeptide-like helical domain containing protein [Parasponia andersonii]
MMLHCHVSSSREFGQEGLHSSMQTHVFSPSKLQYHQTPFTAGAFLGFSPHNHTLPKRQQHSSLAHASPTHHQKLDLVLSSHAQNQNSRGSNVFVGFKLQCHSKTLAFPTKVASVNVKKKRYGGVLPSILRSLESSSDIEKTLNECGENLCPKEQTVVLKEQRSWEKVIRVFEWFKSQREYESNVIHYNVVLRALGRAQKWDELRLCWIDMAKNGVLPTNNTYGMLVDVYGKAGLVKEALLWIKHMRARGIFPDEVTMNTVVRVLKDGGEYDRAHRFYKDWCSGRIELDDLDLDSIVDRSGCEPISFKHFLSTELFKTGGRIPTPKISASLDAENSIQKPRLTSTYNTLIDLCGKAGRLEDAANMFGEMLKSGVAMDTITFNTIIFTCGSHGHLSEAEALLAKMEERRISPDTKTYNIFLSLYAEVGNIDRALECYRKIREVGLYPDAVTHRAVLHVLCRRNMVQDVETVIEYMETSGVQIDEHSVPGVINMYVENGMLDQAKSFFEKCHKDGGYSSKTYAAIIDAYAEKGLWVEAEEVFFRKRDAVGRKWSVIEYNVMIKAYGKTKLYDKAFSLFRGMRNHGTWPDECTYNSLIQMFSKGDSADQAIDLLSEMQEMGFKPNCLTFSALIACYARLGQLSEAVDMYQKMLSIGAKPNEVVFGSLINGFAESGKVEEALKIFNQMEESGISANQIILTSLIKAYGKVGCLEGANALYDRMKGFEGGPDIVASNSMINLYTELGMVSEAKMVFEDLREKGVVDEVSFSTMMNLYKSTGMLDDAIQIAEEMKHNGLVKDCASFSMVMACYATSGQLHKCGELLHEMITRKILPDFWTFNVLFTVLKKGGISIEAVTQLESSYEESKPYSRQAIIASVFSIVGMHALALEFCEVLTKANLNLDSSAYNVAIYAYGAAGLIDKALNMFLKMQDENIEPDVVTYINLVGCYGKAGMVEGVKRIYSQLKSEEIQQSEALYKAIIDAYRSANRHDLANLASQEMKFALESGQCDGSETEDELDETFPDLESP